MNASTAVEPPVLPAPGLPCAAADPVRWRLLAVLAGGTRCVCELQPAAGVSAPALSHHLKVLRRAGLVTAARRGRWIDYSLAPARRSGCAPRCRCPRQRRMTPPRAFAWALGWLILRHYPDLWAGVILYTLTPCIGWYLIFTDQAKGDVAWGVSLLPWNLVLQIVLLPVYLWILVGRRTARPARPVPPHAHPAHPPALARRTTAGQDAASRRRGRPAQDGHSPPRIAIRQGRTDIAELLARHGARDDTVRLLLDRGAGIEARDTTWDSTALNWAQVGSGILPHVDNPAPGWTATIRALIEAGASTADITLSPDDPKPPSPQVAQLLRSYGIGAGPAAQPRLT